MIIKRLFIAHKEMFTSSRVALRRLGFKAEQIVNMFPDKLNGWFEWNEHDCFIQAYCSERFGTCNNCGGVEGAEKICAEKKALDAWGNNASKSEKKHFYKRDDYKQVNYGTIERKVS